MSSPDVTQYYAADHDRLDHLFKTFQESKKGDFEKAKKAFVDFKFGLQRHIIWEEDILFPLFDEKTGMKNSGPTAVMRLEHQVIKKALEEIHECVAGGRTDSDEAEAKLLGTLSIHNQKEESILYPTIDRLFSAAEKERIFKRMEDVPPERYEKCC